jgi:hypothetical protein
MPGFLVGGVRPGCILRLAAYPDGWLAPRAPCSTLAEAVVPRLLRLACFMTHGVRWWVSGLPR